ncbi:hypothetical protein GDO86_017599 [Hymenochirus boettgeri]|uniref:BTB domain-containing protein n=1 Tax=Hymenochirus boettgeri TaxID=247094 RepID=A0A8T2IP53_9PIPI|nr:hypothetical protein GDO86_017599 [Hymenochirus boettgeri]
MSSDLFSYCLLRLAAPSGDPAGLTRALCELRSRHVSRTGGARAFRESGGLGHLVALFTEPSRAAALGTSRRNVDLALSLLANCCMETESRKEVRDHAPRILNSVCVDSIWNRVVRALGNLALEAENRSIINESGVISTIINILQSSKDSPCLQSCLRTLRIMGDSPAHRLSICEQGGISPCASLLSSTDTALVEAAVRSVSELSRGCSLDCAEQLSSAVPVLVALAGDEGGKPKAKQAALTTLCNLCVQGAMRPILGNAGTIQLLITEAKDQLDAPSRCLNLVRALCFCCREAVNRIRLKEHGGLELLLDFLRDSRYHTVHYRITAAFLHFCYDLPSLAILSGRGLAPLLAERLDKLALTTEGQGEIQEVQNTFAEEGIASASFDFPPEPKRKRQGSEGTSEDNFRSWLLSEGYIHSLEDVSSEWCLDNENKEPIVSDDLTKPNTSELATPPTTPTKFNSGDQFTSPRVRRPRHTELYRREQKSLSSPPVFSSSTLSSHCSSPMQEILGSPFPIGPRPSPASELFGPELPGLLLLSFFSQLPESCLCLVSPVVLGGLLSYVTCHPQPSPRAARLLQRLTCDPAYLEAFIRTGGVCTVRARLLLRETPEKVCEENSRHPDHARELGHVLLRNLGIQAESPFGVGAVTHMLLSGPQNDRLQCALSLPYIFRKDSAHRKQLLDAALRLVLEALVQCVDSDLPDFFFHASECLSSLLTPHTPPVPSRCNPVTPSRCRYKEFVRCGEGDVVFVLDGGKKIVGNRKKVSEGCEVFRAMLEGGYAESHQNEVCVREIPSYAFIPLLHYLHGCAEEALCPAFWCLQRPCPSKDLAQSPLGAALAVAGRFLLPGLESVLEDIVKNYMLSLDSLPSVYSFAEIHEILSLQRECCQYLLKRPHRPRQRAICLFQLCQRVQDKKRLFKFLEEIMQDGIGH